LLIVSDDQRPDTIHALGNSIIQTPHLDRLVRRGTSFTRAVCGNPICTPARAEILTGTSGFRNGVLDFGKPIRDDVPRLANLLRSAGYATWYTGKWHNSGRPSNHGYQHVAGLFAGGGGRFATPQIDHAGRPVTGYTGWVFQSDDRQLDPSAGVGLTPDISVKFADAAIQVIAGSSEQPYFLHVNFTAPHDPLLIPAGFESMYAPGEMPLPENFQSSHPFDHGNFDGRDERLFQWPRTEAETCSELSAYYAVISHMDAQIGRILDAVERSVGRNNTIVIFTSDHGLAIGSHGLRGKQNMYEHTIGVPLIMAGPGIPEHHSCAMQCYLRDICPTVCDLAGLDSLGFTDSISLLPAMRGNNTHIRREVFGYFRNVQRMIRTDRWKLIHYPKLDRWQMFDLQEDPQELRDLSQHHEYEQQQMALREKLRAWQRQVNDPALPQ
jgi:arylsulfatase A-like enzyme